MKSFSLIILIASISLLPSILYSGPTTRPTPVPKAVKVFDAKLFPIIQKHGNKLYLYKGPRNFARTTGILLKRVPKKLGQFTGYYRPKKDLLHAVNPFFKSCKGRYYLYVYFTKTPYKVGAPNRHTQFERANHLYLKRTVICDNKKRASVLGASGKLNTKKTKRLRKLLE